MDRKVLFVHDGPRWINAEGQHFGTMVDIEMYKRYQYLGKNVSFMMRLFKKNNDSLININDYGLYIKPVVPFNRPTTLLNYRKSKLVIKEHVKNADVLVIRLPSTIGSVAMKIAMDLNKPFLVEVVACPWDSLRNHSLLGRLYAPFSKNKLRKLVFKAPFVNYVTKHFLQERYPNPNNSVGLSDVIIKNMPDSNLNLKRNKNFQSDDLKIATLGVVNLPYKGHRHVLEAISILLKEGLHIRYTIVGGGDATQLKEIVKHKGIERQVDFMGKIPHDEVFEILDHTDIYIQPSETEGLPRALVEAMSRGCACISSDAGGMPELLDSRVIFKSKNVNDLVLKIRYLLDKNNLIEQSKLNFEKAKEYKFEVLEKRRHDFYDKFLASIHDK